jgi:hypothetical protein
MAYFNHAFQKAFIGTSAFNVNAGGGGSTPPFNGTGSTSTSSGTTVTVPTTTGLTVGMYVAASGGTGAFSPGTFVTNVISATQFTVNVAPIVALAASNVQGWYSSLSQPTGGFTFVDPNTLRTPVADNSAFNAHTLKCPLVLASGSVHGQWTGGKDKVGPFHGGYTESVKSKTINPRFVSAFYRVDACPIQQAQVTIGENTTTSIPSPGTCSQEYLCNETYYLRVDLKGSPALRFLTRNSYYTASAYTGCCAAGSLAPTAVNPLIVYVNWAYQLLNSPLIGPFIQVQITYSINGGTDYFALGDGTNSAANLALLQSYVLGNTALPANATPSLTKGGLIINGAYGDTRFNDCTFYPNDSIIAFLEPIQVYASEVDLNGDPCAFSSVCINNTCKAIQQKGTGENIIRSVIMTQAYSQDPFYTGQDLRIREITNGTDVYGTINRFQSYSRYYLQHSVPRFNNPTGTFDNDQYLLEIIAPATVSLTLSAASGTGAAVINASNAINFTTNNVATGYIATITYTPPGATAGVIATATVTVGAGTITIASVTTTIPAGSVITFQAAFTRNFEDFTNRWISNAQSPGSTACVQLEVYNCPASCTVVPTNP